MSFGKFVEQTFVDGTSPAINADRLNELERVVALTDEELSYSKTLKLSDMLEYFAYKNTKRLLDFNDYTEYTNSYPSNSTLSDDKDNQIMDISCMESLITTASAAWISFYSASALGLDLSVFEDGQSVSSADDFIIIFAYVSDADAIDQIEMRLGDDFSNSYFWETTGNYTIEDGWNVIMMQKSEFVTIGSPTGWDSIDYIRFAPYVNAGYSGEYIRWNNITMYRRDADNITWANPFQRYNGTSWENVFELVDAVPHFFSLHYDSMGFVLKFGMMKVMGGTGGDYPTLIHLYCSVIEFVSKFEIYCKEAGETCAIAWYVDASNYAQTYISGDTFYLDVYEATVKTSTSKALTNGLSKDEVVYIYFEKKEDTIRAIMRKRDEKPFILEHETSISSDSDGCIYLGQIDVTGNGLGFVTDFKIGSKPILNDLQNENLPIYIRKYNAQDFASTTLTNLTRFENVYLPPNGAYKIDVTLILESDNSSPNFRLAWETTQIAGFSSRMVFAPHDASSDPTDTNMKMTQYAFATNVVYGVGATNESYVRETAILTTGFFPGYFTLKGSQNASYPSNAVTVNYKSFILITKINPQ